MYNNGLKLHQTVHTREKPFSCTLCEQLFSCASALNLHYKRTHTSNLHYQEKVKLYLGERPFSCSYYDKCIKDKLQLAVHEMIHTGEKPHECSYCGKRFRQLDVLNRHKKVHTREKPYSCTQCINSFSEPSSLKGHTKRHHMGQPERNFHCTVLSFRKQKGLSRHHYRYRNSQGSSDSKSLNTSLKDGQERT